MKNITQDIKKAINQNVLWSINTFYDFIETIRNKGFEVSFWDGEENWAILIVAKTNIGYLWEKYPLLFIQSNYLDNIKYDVEDYSFLSIISVDDLNTNVLKLNYDELTEHFEYGIDYNKFSVTDLWFHTNSI